mmetsp:Transcript_948/g.1256  ORF Transcript_948/g.1256 Transcript_948/m.1256 type:complete len:605 (-) Transcript_948:58-1872(-)
MAEDASKVVDEDYKSVSPSSAKTMIVDDGDEDQQHQPLVAEAKTSTYMHQQSYKTSSSNSSLSSKKIENIYSDEETDRGEGSMKEDDDEDFTEPVAPTTAPALKEVKPKQSINIPKSNRIVDFNRCKYVPLRLTEEERKLLNVLENALEVCEYTDVVDVTFSHTRKSKVSRIYESLVDVLSISCGLIMANNLTKGEQLISSKSLTDNVPLFTQLFEIGRRYKIMNPSKMRNTYGKLMYILMDTESYQIKSELNFTLIKPILTVSSFLESRKKIDILEDPLWVPATSSVSNITGEKSKRELAAESARKQEAVEQLKKKYVCDVLSEDDLQRLIDSIADNEAFLDFNMKPVERILSILTDEFDPRKPVENFSLQLTTKPKTKMFSNFSLYSGYSSGFMSGGACLNHDHATQFKFVLQTFTLWREIMNIMSKLWLLADADITSEAYRLVDTGQGYQRLQTSPRIRTEMNRILSLVQKTAGSWVGLSVVHLGDRDVPNALVFIDKYTQVSRILAPIVQCMDQLPNLVSDAAFHRYVSQDWGSIHGLRLQILSDFFKHGFDGSGDDGGSCIDGRLTSAWNWCSKLHKKPYYYVFMFTGFQGFDGDWKEN